MRYVTRYLIPLLWLLLSLAAPMPASALGSESCRDPVRGINLVPLPSGWYNGAPELKFPTQDHITYYQAAGMNAVRLPIVWETIQPALYGDLNLRYLRNALDFLDKANSRGVKVVIDLHNYGRYQGKLVGSTDVPPAAFKDIWQRLARVFSSNPAVFAYGLMNEPHDTGGLWHSVAQSGVDGIRSVDSVRQIYVAGDSWSNSQRWPVVNPEPFVIDPQNLIVYEAHIYFDDDFSGRYQTLPGSTDMAARAEQRLQPFINWLKKHKQRGVIGEFGVPMGDQKWLLALRQFLTMSDAACLDWFVWAGGGWREGYELSHEPINGKDRPQMEVLRSWLKAPAR